MTKHLLALTVLLILIKVPVFSQEDDKSKLIGNAGDIESAINICADPAGNKYIAGQTNGKGLVIKQDVSNTIVWSKTLAFGTNPLNNVNIGFLDIVGDTVFGCGKVIAPTPNTGLGSFYFKMNAQTGAIYWSKYEAGGENYWSCMRYAAGKFFLVGGSYAYVSNFGGRVMAVSSQTGNIIWQTPRLTGFLTTPNPNLRTHFLSATEMINGKMFVTGAVSSLNGSEQAPILIGINQNGTVFLQKYMNIAIAMPGSDEYFGVRIEYDQAQDLIIQVSDNILNNGLDPFLMKCDTLGNLVFAKRYGLTTATEKFFVGINETATRYVTFGLNLSPTGAGGDYLYVMKVFKDGTFDTCISISKPNVSYYSPVGLGFLMGNCTYLNNLHYFITSESAVSVYDTDISPVTLDEDLNLVGDCSETMELPYVTTDVQLTVMDLGLITVASPLAFSNGITIQDQLFNDPCIGVSLNLAQNTVCESTITAAVSGFTDPTFYWSDGTVGSSNSITVTTTDTVFLRVLDTKCCELIDTIIPSVIPADFTFHLPNDTTICIQPGSSYSIVPVLSEANVPVNYLWSNHSTGPALSVTSSGTYWVEISNSCFTQRDSIALTVNFLPVIGNLSDTTVCEGNFPVTLNPTVSAGASIVWDDGSTVASRSVNGPGSYILSVSNDCGTADALIIVTQTDLPHVQLVPSIDTCVQNGIAITLSPIYTSTTAVLWSDGSNGNQLDVSHSGNYMVYASNVCGTDSASSQVTINHFPELDLPAVLDTCFDVGVGFSYTAQGSAGSYQWSSGSQTETEWISQEGIYSVMLTNLCGSTTDSMFVTRKIVPDLYFPEDSVRYCERQLAVSRLHIETNYGLEILNPYHGSVEISLDETGWYTIHAFNGCWHKWDSIYVDLQDAFFYLPNSFTPNGDSYNDRFEFKGENIVVRDVRIFNRWGEEIFTENGKFTGWDGTYRGEICPDGMYAVHIIYEDCFGMPTEFNGHVNLVR